MGGEMIIVGVDASKEMTDYALEWAVQNVIKPNDSLLLLAILPCRACPPPPPHVARNQTHQTIHNFLSRLRKKRSTRHKEEDSYDKAGFVDDMPHKIYNVGVQMIQLLFSVHKVVQVIPQVKVVAYAPMGSVAMAAKELGATWIILDRCLKKEGDCCLKQTNNCNIILVDHAIPKVLRSLNSSSRAKKLDEGSDPMVADMLGGLPSTFNLVYDSSSFSATPTSTLLGSYAQNSNITISSSETDASTSLFPQSTTRKFSNYKTSEHELESSSETMYGSSPHSSNSQPLNKVSRFDLVLAPKSRVSSLQERPKSSTTTTPSTTLLKTRSDVTKNSRRVKTTQAAAAALSIPSRRSTGSHHLSKKATIPNPSRQLPMERRKSISSTSSSKKNEALVSSNPKTIDRTSSIRKAMSLSIKHPPPPPPLCSVCKHSAPVFGRTNRKFSYEELKTATNCFCAENLLAKGGYGMVYRGVLADGQVVAVKKHAAMNAQGASEFCSEVEVLSCAQHKNLVMLVGYCIEIEWLLVYEFACNGSLDQHLYGNDTSKVMEWHHRMKVAIGAARGLRYLHEDCRVGCIVHRDFRPNNILLTHDYESMVGDFGLARWQTDGQSAEETRVIGAIGYLAPEYTECGLITEKADVYAFGLVLLELLTGAKATEFSRNARQQYMPEWSRLLVERKVSEEIVDPRLEKNYVVKEVECMIYAACLCITHQPEQRPRMSKVLKILEGNMPRDMTVNYQGGELTTMSPRQSKLDTDRPWNQKLDNYYSPTQQVTHKMENQRREPSENEDQYKEYLQESLSRYIQKLNINLSIKS